MSIRMKRGIALQLYVVEACEPDGRLKFDCEQPPVMDWDEDDLSALAWKHNPDAMLDGRDLLCWLSSNVNPHWRTRVKTW